MLLSALLPRLQDHELKTGYTVSEIWVTAVDYMDICRYHGKDVFEIESLAANLKQGIMGRVILDACGPLGWDTQRPRVSQRVTIVTNRGPAGTVWFRHNDPLLGFQAGPDYICVI